MRTAICSPVHVNKVWGEWDALGYRERWEEDGEEDVEVTNFMNKRKS